jgi:putative ABC transport system permease protein
MPPGRPVRPKVEDVALLRQRVVGLDEIVGEMRRWGVSLTYGRKTVNGRVNGTSPPFGDLRNHIAQAGGRFIDPQDEEERRRVIFLGEELAKDIFGTEDPVGKKLLVDKAPYTVIGVMQKKIQMGTYGGPDRNGAVIPLTTFRAQFGREILNNLVIRPEDPAQMKQVVKCLREVLAGKYGFDPSDEPALGVWDTIEGAAVTRKILVGIELFLASSD